MIKCRKCLKVIDISENGEHTKSYLTFKYCGVCYNCWKYLTPSEETNKPEKPLRKGDIVEFPTSWGIVRFKRKKVKP